MARICIDSIDKNVHSTVGILASVWVKVVCLGILFMVYLATRECFIQDMDPQFPDIPMTVNRPTCQIRFQYRIINVPNKAKIKLLER